MASVNTLRFARGGRTCKRCRGWLYVACARAVGQASTGYGAAMGATTFTCYDMSKCTKHVPGSTSSMRCRHAVRTHAPRHTCVAGLGVARVRGQTTAQHVCVVCMAERRGHQHARPISLSPVMRLLPTTVRRPQLDLFCKGCIPATSTPSAAAGQPQQQSIGVAGGPLAALAGQVGGRAPGADVLARCTHVALLAHPAWPLSLEAQTQQQTPQQPLPPVLCWPVSARRLLEAAQYAPSPAPPPPHTATSNSGRNGESDGIHAAAGAADSGTTVAVAVDAPADGATSTLGRAPTATCPSTVLTPVVLGHAFSLSM